MATTNTSAATATEIKGGARRDQRAAGIRASMTWKATLVTETTEAGWSELRRPPPKPASSPHDVQDEHYSCHEKAQDVRGCHLHICCHRHERGSSVVSAQTVIPEFR